MLQSNMIPLRQLRGSEFGLVQSGVPSPVFSPSRHGKHHLFPTFSTPLDKKLSELLAPDLRSVPHLMQHANCDRITIGSDAEHALACREAHKSHSHLYAGELRYALACRSIWLDLALRIAGTDQSGSSGICGGGLIA